MFDCVWMVIVEFEGQQDVVQGVECGYEVECLEDEVDLVVLQDCEVDVFQVCDFGVVDLGVVFGWVVEFGYDVYQGGFVGVGWFYDGGELVVMDVYVYVIECLYCFFVGVVGFFQMLDVGGEFQVGGCDFYGFDVILVIFYWLLFCGFICVYCKDDLCFYIYVCVDMLILFYVLIVMISVMSVLSLVGENFVVVVF